MKINIKIAGKIEYLQGKIDGMIEGKNSDHQTELENQIEILKWVLEE